MSERALTLYTLHCDFPGCTNEYEDGEYGAWRDTSEAVQIAHEQENWLVNSETYESYCSEHIVRVAPDPDEDLDDPGPWGWMGRMHAPMEDTFANRMTVALDTVMRMHAEWRFRRVEDDLQRQGARDRTTISNLSWQREREARRAAIGHPQ